MYPKNDYRYTQTKTIETATKTNFVSDNPPRPMSQAIYYSFLSNNSVFCYLYKCPLATLTQYFLSALHTLLSFSL